MLPPKATLPENTGDRPDGAAHRDRHDGNASEISNLVETIRDAIERRSFYMLMDDRADLIVGKKFNPHNLMDLAKVHQFASAHGWEAIIAASVITFNRPAADRA